MRFEGLGFEEGKQSRFRLESSHGPTRNEIEDLFANT